ncbi:MAG: hypothetical protein ACLFWB_05055, partial [Armatimonadota bacterium]
GRLVFTGRGENRGTAGQSPLDAYMIVRHTGQEPLRSTFIAVHEPFQEEDLGLSVERVPMDGYDDAQMPAGVKVITADGAEFALHSVLGRWDGERYVGPQSINITGPEGSMQVNWPPESPNIIRGELADVDYAQNRMMVQSAQDLSQVAGQTVHIQNPAYARATAFDIASVEQAGEGRWWVKTELEPIIASNAITEIVPEKRRLISPYNIAKQRECRHVFDGKPMVSAAQPDTIIHLKTLRTDMGNDVPTQILTLPEDTDLGLFEVGGSYRIYDFAPGDTIYVCHTETG